MSGDANLGSLVAKLGIDTATLRNTIGEAKQHFQKLKLDTDQAAAGIGGAFQKSGAIAAASILAIGVGAAAFSVKAAHAFEDVGREVIKLQRYTGGTAEEMSKLRFAAQQSGVDTDKLTRSMGLLSKNLQSGKGDFDKFGIATVDANGKTLPLNAVLLNVAQRFKEMPNGAEKTAAAIKMFGRAGADLLPMLNKGRDGLEALERQAAKYGQVLTEKNIVAVKASVAAHREQAAAWQGLQLQIGAEVLPALTSLTKSFTEGLLVVMPAVSRIIGDTVVPVFSGLAAVVGGVTHLLAEHTNAAKGLAVVVGGPVVLALTAWAAAQAKVVATSIGTFLSEGAAGAAAMAVQLNLLTANAETGALSLKAVNVATGAAFAGIGLVIAKIIGDNQKMQSSAEKTAAAITKGAESPQAALEQHRARLAEFHKEMGGGVNVLGLHVRATDRDAKAAAEASNGYKATKAEIERLNTELGNADHVSGAVEDSFTKQGLALETLGGATKLTTAQVEQLAASMNIDLSKAQQGDIDKMTEQAARLTITSTRTLKLADDQKVLGDWTADVTKQTAAFTDALNELIGTATGADRADIAFRDSLDKMTQAFKDNGTAVDLNTAKGRANRGAVDDSIDAILRQAKANTDAGATWQSQVPIIDQHIAQLKDVWRQAGLNAQQIAALIAQYHLTPSEIRTALKLDTSQAVKSYDDYIRSINGGRLPGVGTVLAPNHGSLPAPVGHAAGGIITRPMISALGEGGKPEVVLPLTDPRRMRELIGQAGIGNLFAGSNPAAGGTTQHVTLNVEAPRDAGLMAQVEYAGRVLGWQLDPAGS